MANYETTYEANLRNQYPFPMERLGDGESVVIPKSIGRVGLALGLGQEQDSWIDIRFPGNFVDDQEGSKIAVEANLINPSFIMGRNANLGRTALVDRVLLDSGDSFSFGRYKYPSLREQVSRRHVRLSVKDIKDGYPGINLEIEDLGSSNGSRLYGHRRNTTREDWDSGSPFGRDTSSEERAASRDVFEMYMEKYAKIFPNLSPADYQVCAAVIADMRNRFADDRDKMQKQFNRWMHPDMIRHLDDRVAHNMYLLVKEELGL